MCSDNEQLKISALAKLNEFKECGWFRIREQQSELENKIPS